MKAAKTDFTIVAWMFVYILMLVLMIYILKFHVIEFFSRHKLGNIQEIEELGYF
jgi:hypothetical protein